MRLILHTVSMVVGDTRVCEEWSSVSRLLQFKPTSISAEIAFNRREAALQPHCCVCSLFVPVIDYTSS